MIKHLLFGFLFGVLVSYVGIRFHENPKEIPIISPIAESFTQTVVYTYSKIEEARAEEIPPELIEKALDGSTGTYAVVIKHLKTKQTYQLNEHLEFEPASIYKLWIMGTVFQMLEEKELDENEVLRDSVPALNQAFSISPENAELTEGYIAISIKEALNKMITISHNYDAMILSKRIRLATVTTYLQENGFTESSVGKEIHTTAHDVAVFYEKLYNGELGDPLTTQKMLSLLKNQTFNHKLPKYLPPDVVIAHKTGELGSLSHDAGIVYGKNGDYIIVVLSDSSSPKGAEERIAQISKAVYEFFEK